MTVVGLLGIEYQLDTKSLSSGGEGDIYRVVGGADTKKQVVKLYHPHAISSELEEKLKFMVKHPPSSKVLTQVAWPLDVVCDANSSFCGFVMPELSINAELGDIYKYPPAITISSQQKIIIAENICAVISAVHKAGYVFGDFNPRNIGVDKNTGKVAFLDTDSYHVIDRELKKVYRCNVCAPGYSAPELLEKCADYVSTHPDDSKQAYAKTPLPTFTQETDNFALAIHIFKLLNNGYTPFGGIKETESASQASPGTGDAAVRRDNYCFKPGNKPQSAAIPPLEVFSQEVADLFTRAFMYGKIDPKQRPSAVEWYKALEGYEESLVTCPENQLHQYDPKNTACPWCEADKQYVTSIEPTIQQKQYKATNVSPNQQKQHATVNMPVQPPVYPSNTTTRERHGFTSFVLIGGVIAYSILGIIYLVQSFVAWGYIRSPSLFITGIYLLMQAVCCYLLIRWKKIGFWLLIGFTVIYPFGMALTPSPISLTTLSSDYGNGDFIIRIVGGLIGIACTWGILQIRKNGKSTWKQLT